MSWISNTLGTVCVIVLLSPIWLPVAATLVLLALPTTLLAWVTIFIRLTFLSAEATISLVISSTRQLLREFSRRLSSGPHAQELTALNESNGAWDTSDDQADAEEDYFFDEFGRKKPASFLRRVQSDLR
ncbi:hypothetical protein THASP1DRAFT_27196 [Thamnocephalis sphaerospora]|uniref:Uncharacterized protein n=1 Tax=Thamnocephalis sphaerospora TaxID=78915 RepID=A0A4P9XX61_9FUNG|nr:hypothetical protein THASP1DRAFT_27196 [Thamnocephalis sphaerospora]|eukprot:RKP11023.1 hypothetical protein THASP1DRAFT_27196 [Thamnocephalis sphaerospora]